MFTMTQHDALLAAVCAAPDDDLPRLVYADWCDENGDPDRAEFIRTQVEIAKGAKGKKLVALQKREKELLTEHSAKWTEPLREFADRRYSLEPFRFRRGFVEDIATHGDQLTEHGDDLFRLAPVRTLRMSDQDVESLHDCEQLLRVTTLELTGCALDEEYRGTAKFFGSRALANLTTLIAQGFDDNGHLDAGALRALVESKHLNNLRRLDIGDNWLFNISSAEQPEVVRLLTALGNLPSLTDVGLGGIGIPARTVQELASQPWMTRITKLDLRGNGAGTLGGWAIAESPYLENIELLDLRDNETIDIDEEGDGTPMSDDVKRLLKRRFGKRVLE
jgi:uncharacterized protein (TIGR02996 family)